MKAMYWGTTEVIRTEEHSGLDYDVQTYSKWNGFIDRLFQRKPTIAELPKHQFLTFRAVTQGNQITRGCR